MRIGLLSAVMGIIAADGVVVGHPLGMDSNRVGKTQDPAVREENFRKAQMKRDWKKAKRVACK